MVKACGRWVKTGYRRWLFKAWLDDTIHAEVLYQPEVYAEPWLCYTCHTEGNDRFATRGEAQRHAVRRLNRRLTEMEPLCVRATR